MTVQIANVSETWERDVFTDRGMYCGKVKDVECDLKRFKLRALVVEVVKGSYMSSMIGKKKGLIIPFPMVMSIGDVIIVKHVTPKAEELSDLPEGPSSPRIPSEEA
jgi:sporulation protein YlmC with PRC-barrel domain